MLDRRTAIAAALLVGLALAPTSGAQSQEPKPIPPGQEPTGALVAVQPGEGEAAGTPDVASQPGVSGVVGSSYTSPAWGYSLSWDPAVWTVEAESADPGYDGLQLGTPRSTLYVEGYEAFAGDAETCLRSAVVDVGGRDGTGEIEALPGRPTPLGPDLAPQQILLRYVQSYPDGSSAEMNEFVACLPLAAGASVLEITIQVPTSLYEAELPLATAVLATLILPPTAA